MPKLNRGAFAPIINISSFKILTSSFERPPPPYSFETVGIVHPFEPILSNQILESGFLYTAFLPPQTSSTGVFGSAPFCIEEGQFSFNQSFTSCLKLSNSFIKDPLFYVSPKLL